MAEKEQKQLEQILKHRKKYVLRKDSTRRSLDVNKDTIKDLYDFVATIAEDMNKMNFGK